MKHLRFIFILLILTGCQPQSDNEDESILARFDDEYLYESALKGMIPNGISTRDSLILVKNYINSWITNQVLIRKAEHNLTRDQKDFSRQIREYRNSLLVYEYEKKLLEQELDTIVEDAEISAYLEEYQQNFILKQDIYSYDFLQIPVEQDRNGTLEELFSQSNPSARDSIISIMIEVSGLYDFNEDNWVSFEGLKRRFPGIFSSPGEEDFLGKMYKDSNDTYITLLNIKDRISKGETAPFSYVKNDIYDIIINKRKAEFIKKMHNELVQQAYQKKEAEIY